jgi:cell division protein FtsB
MTEDIKIEDVLAVMRDQIASQAQEIAVLKATNAALIRKLESDK